MTSTQIILRASASIALFIGGSLSSGVARGADLPEVPSKAALLDVLAKENNSFTPSVRSAYLAYAKDKARADLTAQNRTIPADFLAWIDSDPQMEAGVYGAQSNAADVLVMLYSLSLDLGETDFRKYRQLALAAALVHIKEAANADISPREPLKLVINGDPRIPVDTKEAGRELDMNDHIITFLNDHTIEEEVVVGHKEVLPELKYDERGIAIPQPKATRKPKKAPVVETRTRSLYAADVLASRKLQEQFNAYMKSKGFPVEIDCGDQVVHWKSRAMVRGAILKQIREAQKLFQTAYEEKGLLPQERDPFPSPAERVAFLIRNDRYQFSTEEQKTHKRPSYPLTAPWPTLTLLVTDNQPLRERQERWEAFRNDGVFKTYGEYIGSVAQQFDMQSARRLKPYPFTYGSVQMMLKDGGVCGAMANISVRTHNTMGVPACTASQPGHCAFVAFRFDPKTATYACKGGQYATGGDDKTTPHAGWCFGEMVRQSGAGNGEDVYRYPRKPMVYHQSIAWAVNHGMESFLDSTMAWHIFNLLPEADRQTSGMKLLGSGLALNPYNFLIPDRVQAAAESPDMQIRFYQYFQTVLANQQGKPGSPSTGLYNQTVRKQMFKRIAELPIPEDRRAVRMVLAYLEKEKCDLPAAVVAYRLADKGLPALLSHTEREFRVHLNVVQNSPSRESEIAATAMADTLRIVAWKIADRTERKKWAQKQWEEIRGRDSYFGHKYRVITHPAVPQLAKMAGMKMPPLSELRQPLLDAVERELRESVAGQRDLQNCRTLATKIKAVGSTLNKVPELKREWFESLAEVISGKETFRPANAKRNARPQKDPCADAIRLALNSERSP